MADGPETAARGCCPPEGARARTVAAGVDPAKKGPSAHAGAGMVSHSTFRPRCVFRLTARKSPSNPHSSEGCGGLSHGPRPPGSPTEEHIRKPLPTPALITPLV